MKNSSTLKNELIFHYAAGTTSIAKSLMASTYLFLNSHESQIYQKFEKYCGEELKKSPLIEPTNLKAEDCIKALTHEKEKIEVSNNNPINKFIPSYSSLKWKKIFKGFYEYSLNLSKKDNIKLIKMNPGTSVPLHSHNGKEYILVLEGSFNDEYGNYSKGSLQINDSNVKHTPIANDKNGCICLSITEKQLVFYGPFAPILNLISFFKSLLIKN
jgi:putative transcriptional regulator